MKTATRTAPRFAAGDVVRVEGMPSYGPMPIEAVKWSFASGWWLDVRSELGVWVVHESQAVSA